VNGCHIYTGQAVKTASGGAVVREVGAADPKHVAVALARGRREQWRRELAVVLEVRADAAAHPAQEEVPVRQRDAALRLALGRDELERASEVEAARDGRGGDERRVDADGREVPGLCTTHFVRFPGGPASGAALGGTGQAVKTARGASHWTSR
jgi:hypothetical protein